MSKQERDISVIKDIIINNGGYIRLHGLFKELVLQVNNLKDVDDARIFVLKTLKKYPSVVNFSNSGYLTLDKEFIEKPSQIKNGSYLFANPIKENLIYADEISKYDTNLGKWLLFVNKNDIDEVWEKIKKSTEEGHLGVLAKLIFPNKEEPNKYVICIVTHNWTWKENVMLVRENLRKLGFINKISYKKDTDTGKKYSRQGDKNISEYYE